MPALQTIPPVFQATAHPGEILRIERTEIFHPFPYTDKVNRQAIFLSQGDDNTALGGAIELGHAEAA